MSVPGPLTRKQRRMARRARRRRWTVAVLVVAIVAGLGLALGLGHAKHAAAAGPVTVGPAKSTESPFYAKSSPNAAKCPLSGLGAPGGKVPLRPALAIKVDNYPAARPQTGLDHADVVFEELVEGGITRFVAVFQCQLPPKVGPVRSSRYVDIDIVSQLSRPVFAYAGGINPVLKRLAQANVINENVLDLPSILQRDPNRVAPYNAYVSPVALLGLHPGDTSPPAPLFEYSPVVPAGAAAGEVYVPFSGVAEPTWIYDSSRGEYDRYYGSSPAYLTSGNVIDTTNIVIQMVTISYGPWVENSEGALEVKSNMVGSGPAMIFRNGVEISGTWERSSLGTPTRFITSAGNRIALAPGRTWVEIVPVGAKVAFGPKGASTAAGLGS